ncbi:MAG TPA: ATP-binding protein, partial [bacterium]|nr:ATP-binding protein [bacterium]
MSGARPKLVMGWSGGKDSALALLRLQRQGRYEVAGLLTTVTEAFHRISMHGVRDELLQAQAQAVGLPLLRVL